jgi:hypothetical protein
VIAKLGTVTGTPKVTPAASADPETKQILQDALDKLPALRKRRDQTKAGCMAFLLLIRCVVRVCTWR